MKVYELSDAEAKLVEDWRLGKVIFDGELWVRLSPKENEVIELWRKVQYGTILLEFASGEPTISKILLEFRHGKVIKERKPALELLPKLQEGLG